MTLTMSIIDNDFDNDFGIKSKYYLNIVSCFSDSYLEFTNALVWSVCFSLLTVLDRVK